MGSTYNELADYVAYAVSTVVVINFRLWALEPDKIFIKQVDTKFKSKELSLGGVGFSSVIALGDFLSFAACNEGVFELFRQAGTQPAERSLDRQV